MKAVIIEDEILIAKELETKIKEVSADVDIVDIIPSLKVAKKWLLNNALPDLFFMDIQLSDGVSFSLFDQFQIDCPVVFTTAYDEYAIKAFKVNGVDYILKPVENDELKHAIDKCRTIVESKQQYPTGIKDFLQTITNGQPANSPVYKEKFIINNRHQWMPVNTKDIAAFSKENLFYIYTFSGDKHILDFESMDEIEELLDPKQFYRANRQCIINIDAIASVKPLENSKLVLTLKPVIKLEVDISREKAPQFKKWMDR
ncbi:MAG: response regulator transcription factor [Bacteroidetes bacterium]|nr:MAG: response regulator transcription factor [Bacteroidota bacterium]